MTSSTSTPQNLLKRNPALTPAQFSENWYKNHAPLVVPMFLAMSVQYYAQIHGPLTTADESLSPTLAEWDGVGETHLSKMLLDAIADPGKVPKWIMDYYKEVVLVDELRCLVSAAGEHLKRVEAGTVRGERRIVIENGKSLVEVPERIWEVWREYENGGEWKLKG